MAPRPIDEFDTNLIAVTHGHAAIISETQKISPDGLASPVPAVAEVAIPRS